MQFACCAFGFIKVGEDAPALFVEGAPGGGDAHTPRSAVEQPGAEALLELQDVLARRCSRKAEPLGGPRKPASLDNCRENPRVFKAIHATRPDCQPIIDNL